MDNLILNSLEIQNFRAFRHLRVEKLGRVNLFVGKNNVGKSSLLEALWLYAQRGSPVWDILEARNEADRSSSPGINPTDMRSSFLSIRHLFHGRGNILQEPILIEIGPVDTFDKTLSISIGLFSEQFDRMNIRRLLYVGDVGDKLTSEIAANATIQDYIPGFVTKIGKEFVSPRGSDGSSKLFTPIIAQIPSALIPMNGLNVSQVEIFWDRIALTNLEQAVVKALQIIASEVERINLIGNQDHQVVGSSTQRIPIVKVAGLDEPMPLRSLGEGMNRMFGIALALANARAGMLLIDEIESGLHYSVQADMWRLVFEMAHRLNVQVFATTHSWDCITAFQQAAREDVHEEGLLIRLERRGEDVRATLFDEAELAIATREQIEVR